MRYHPTPVRMANINKSTNVKCWWGYGEKGTLVHCWWECRLVQPLWRTVWSFLKKLKMELPFDPVIPLLGIYPKKLEIPIRKDICTPMFIAAQSTIARIWKQPRYPSADDCIKQTNKKKKQQQWYIYTMEYYAAIKENWFSSFGATWMELENIMLSEISQSWNTCIQFLSITNYMK